MPLWQNKNNKSALLFSRSGRIHNIQKKNIDFSQICEAKAQTKTAVNITNPKPKHAHLHAHVFDVCVWILPLSGVAWPPPWCSGRSSEPPVIDVLSSDVLSASLQTHTRKQRHLHSDTFTVSSKAKVFPFGETGQMIWQSVPLAQSQSHGTHCWTERDKTSCTWWLNFFLLDRMCAKTQKFQNTSKDCLFQPISYFHFIVRHCNSHFLNEDWSRAVCTPWVQPKQQHRAVKGVDSLSDVLEMWDCGCFCLNHSSLENEHDWNRPRLAFLVAAFQ